jgi:hypothetical protein
MRVTNGVTKAAKRIALMSGAALIAMSALTFESSIASAAAPAANQQIAEGQQYGNSPPQWQKQKHGNNSQQNGQGQNGQGQNRQWGQNAQPQWQQNGQGQNRQWGQNGQAQWQQHGQGQNRQWGQNGQPQWQQNGQGQNGQGQNRQWGQNGQGQNRQWTQQNGQGQSRQWGQNGQPQWQQNGQGQNGQGQNRQWGQNGQGQNRQWGQNGQGQNRWWGQNGQPQWQHNGQGQNRWWGQNGQPQWQHNGQGQYGQNWQQWGWQGGQQQWRRHQYDWSSYHPGRRPPEWDRYRRDFDPRPYQWNRTSERHYRWEPYIEPPGWYYQRWAYGEILPDIFWSQQYWLPNYAEFGLSDPPYGYVWVRYGNDALLVDVESGQILSVEYGIFYA